MTACSQPPAAPVAEVTVWPEPEQQMAVPQSEVVKSEAAVPSPTSTAPTGEDVAGGLLTLEDVCEAFVTPFMSTYLDESLSDDEWLAAVSPAVSPGAIDLSRRPYGDQLEWLAEMPGSSETEVWCEGAGSRGGWLIGVTWPEGQPVIHTLEAENVGTALQPRG